MKITDEAVEAFTQYRRSQVAELRPWQPGDDVSGVSISAEDAKAGSPKSGDMIARNPKNHADQWLVAAAYFADNFEPLAALPHLSQGAVRVKPLEWETPTRANTLIGTYHILEGRSRIAVMLDGVSIPNPFFNTLGEAKAAAQADYERRILSTLSPAPVGVTGEMVLKFITTSHDEDAGYKNWTEAVTAGLTAALASHEPAPRDNQEGKELGYDAHGNLTTFDVRDDDTHEGVSEAGEVVAWRAPINPHGRPSFTYTRTEEELVRFGHHQREPLVRQSALTACQQEVGRLRTENAALGSDGVAARRAAALNLSRAETAEAYNAELLKILEDVKQRCLFADDDGIGVSEDVVIEADLFSRICAALGGQSNE